MTTITAPIASIIFEALLPDVVRSCIVIQPSPPPEPGSEPPDPVGDTGIYTPVPDGVTYDDLPVVTVIDTSPDQMIGCIVTVADNPQGRLDALFPSAIDGDGVIDRATNDIWVYDGAVWNNVGPTPGEVIVETAVIPPWDETIVALARTRTRLSVQAFPYALELLTEPDPITTVTSLLARSVPAYIVVGSTGTTLTAQTPQISISAAITPPALDITFIAHAPTISTGVSLAVPPTDTIVSAGIIPYIGTFSTVIQAALSEATLLAPTPTVLTALRLDIPVVDLSVAAAVPLLNPPIDPYFSSVSILLHLDGTNGSTTFTDSSSNSLTVSASGGTTISTAQSKFGGASAIFAAGSSQYLTASNAVLDLGDQSASWTVENWLYLTSSSPTRQGVWANSSLATSADSWFCRCEFSGTSYRIRVTATNASFATEFQIVTSYSYSLNTWYHIAVSYDATTLRLYVDGTLAGSHTGFNQGLTLNPPNSFYIGATPYFSSSVDYSTGHIDDLRVTKGVARYTTNFTAPTAAFPDV